MYYNSIDSKGRIMIPLTLRDVLTKHYSPGLVFVNEALDPCLLAFPVEEWNRHLEKLNNLPQYNKHVRFYMRKVVASAIECEIDKQGRVLIPAALRKDAFLQKEVVIAGQGIKIEIWDKKHWDDATNPDILDKEAFIKEMVEFNI
jgi:MraZ protein